MVDGMEETSSTTDLDRVALRQALRKSQLAHLVNVMALGDNGVLTISRTIVRDDESSHQEITLIGKTIRCRVRADETTMQVFANLIDAMLKDSNLTCDKSTYIAIGKAPTVTPDGDHLFFISEPQRFPNPPQPPNVPVLLA